jgi:hypothetical protein
MTYGALAAANVKFHHIPVDAQGIDVGVGTRAAPKARAVFVTPSHQFPLGVVLSMARRNCLPGLRGFELPEDDSSNSHRLPEKGTHNVSGLHANLAGLSVRWTNAIWRFESSQPRHVSGRGTEDLLSTLLLIAGPW